MVILSGILSVCKQIFAALALCAFISSVAADSDVSAAAMVEQEYKRLQRDIAIAGPYSAQDQQELLQHAQAHRGPAILVAYAAHVLKAPWPEAEAELRNNDAMALEYLKLVPNSDARKLLGNRVGSMSPEQVLSYARLLGSPDADVESRLIQHCRKQGYMHDQTLCASAQVYLREVKKAPWPEYESMLLANNTGSFLYDPEKVLNWIDSAGDMKRRRLMLNYGRFLTELNPKQPPWPAGTRSLAGGWSDQHVDYARDVLKRPWPALEAAMLADNPIMNTVNADYHMTGHGKWTSEERTLLQKLPRIIQRYIVEVKKTPWPEAEAILLRDPQAASDYAIKVLKKRWPQAEPMLQRHAYAAVPYAAAVVKGAWPEAEASLKRQGQYSAEYATHVLQRRWPEMEAVMLSQRWHDWHAGIGLYDYQDRYHPERWEAYEKILLRRATDGDTRAVAIRYTKERLNGKRWPELEAAMLESDDATGLIEYAETIIGGRWPQAEGHIGSEPKLADRYARDVLKRKQTLSGEWQDIVTADRAIDDINFVAFSHNLRRSNIVENGEQRKELEGFSSVPDYLNSLSEERLGWLITAYMSYVRNPGWYELPEFERDKTVMAAWPAIEPFALRSPKAAAFYAKHVKGGAWPEAEPVIASDKDALLDYVRLTGQPLAGAEPIVREELSTALGYFSVIRGCESIEYESVEGHDCRTAAANEAFDFAPPRRITAEDLQKPLADLPPEVLRFRPGKECYKGRLGTIVCALGRSIKQPWPELERELLKGGAHESAAIVDYVEHVKQAPWPAAEPLIIQAAEKGRYEYLTRYAAHGLKGSWAAAEAILASESTFNNPKQGLPTGEPLIQYCEVLDILCHDYQDRFLSDLDLGVRYAQRVLKARWPLLEPKILAAIKAGQQKRSGQRVIHGSDKDYRAAANYIAGLSERWPELDNYLLEISTRTDPQIERAVVSYIEKAHGGEWSELEPLILKNADFAALYSVIRGKSWRAAESTILKSPRASLLYAEKVLQGRWPDAEKTYADNWEFISTYTARIMKRNWPAFTEGLRDGQYPNHQWWLESELGTFAGQRFPALENQLLQKYEEDSNHAAIYVKHFLKARWPELESKLLEKRERWKIQSYLQALPEGESWPAVEKLIEAGRLSFFDEC